MSGPVFSISGPPGSGKTALARVVATRLGTTLVEYDRYEVFTRTAPEGVEDWFARGAPYAELVAPGLAEAVAAAAAKGPVMLDTPLGPADPVIGPMIARAAWIDCPLDLALARKLGQLAGTVPQGRSEPFLGWMRGYLTAYARIVHPACLLQRDRVAPHCGLTLDGRAPLDELSSRFEQYLADVLADWPLRGCQEKDRS